MTLQGRRREDRCWGDQQLPDDLQPGDYWKYIGIDLGDTNPTNLTRTVWGFYSPDGNGLGILMSHTVRENEDDTISIIPGDGSSNSVLHTGGASRQTWHGYVYDGVWTEC